MASSLSIYEDATAHLGKAEELKSDTLSNIQFPMQDKNDCTAVVHVHSQPVGIIVEITHNGPVLAFVFSF